MPLVRILLAATVLLAAAPVRAHGGPLDACGCHVDRKTRECHCHKNACVCGCGCFQASCGERPRSSRPDAEAASSPGTDRAAEPLEAARARPGKLG